MILTNQCWAGNCGSVIVVRVGINCQDPTEENEPNGLIAQYNIGPQLI